MPKKKATSKRKPPALTSEYHKARRQLVLWSGLLFVWEFIGIDLEAMKTVGGTFGALVQSLKSPRAVPWVLLIVVVYFFYRFVIEWLQFDPKRQIKKAAKIDIMISLGIALISIFLFIVQHLFNVQVALGQSLFGRIFYLIIFSLIAVCLSVALMIVGSLREEKTVMGSFFRIYLLIIIAVPLLYMMIWLIININIIFPDLPMPLARLILIISFAIFLGLPFLPLLVPSVNRSLNKYRPSSRK